MVYFNFIHLCSLKLKIMKNLFLFAASAAILASCGGAEETAVEPVVEVYSLDAAASTLSWTGFKKGAEEGQHTGTINFVKGTTETTDGVLTSGAVTIDATSLTATDLQGEYQGMLNGHLKNSDFFDVEKYPTIEVTYGELKDGKIATTVKVVGAEFTQDVPVSTKVENGNLIVDGKFTFDFEGIKSVGFAAGGEVRIMPQIDYDLHLVFKK